MRIFNKYHGNAPIGSVSIMRPSKWGNPYRIGVDGDRDEVCHRYRSWLASKLNSDTRLLDEFSALMRSATALVCCCYPKRCHGNEMVAEAILRGIIAEKETEPC